MRMVSALCSIIRSCGTVYSALEGIAKRRLEGFHRLMYGLSVKVDLGENRQRVPEF